MNDNIFDQTFFDKTDSELHKMVYSGQYTDQGFLNAALDELRYRRALKSLSNFTGFLDEEIMKLLKREDILPSDVNRKIRDEAVKRKLVAPRLYANDNQKRTSHFVEPGDKRSARRINLIYNEIKDQPNNSPARKKESQHFTPPSPVMPADRSGKNPPPPYQPQVTQQPTSGSNATHAEQQSRPAAHQHQTRNQQPAKRASKRYFKNYWVLQVGKYILVLAAAILLFLIIDILKPDLKTNLFKPADSTLIEKIEKPIKSLGNKIGVNSGQLSPIQAENLLKEKYVFDILAFPVFDGSVNKENTKIKYDKLQNEGLISYSNCSDGEINGYCAALTDKGNLYAVSKVYKDDQDNINYINIRSTILEVGKIVNLKRSSEFDGFEVEFTLNVIATPFGAIWSGLKSETLTRTDLFEKHGSVWHIKGSL